MAVPKNGDQVHVATEARDEVYCENIANLAGKTAYAKAVDVKNDEAFVVVKPSDRHGSFIPLKFLEPTQD